MVSVDLEQIFRAHFRREAEIRTQAPGRVNLIGEHTDYNDGFVFPAAIDRHITILAAARNDARVRAHSVDFSQETSFSLEQIQRSSSAPWSNYLRGVLVQYQDRGSAVPGMDVLIQGNVPIGAGLSSSAAFEVAVAETCRVLGNIDIGKVDLVLLSQSAERKFVGVQCGIMDQFISTLAQKNTAMFLDCRDLTFSLVPLKAETRIIVCDSRVQRRLDSSEYNKRRTECEEAVRLLAGRLGPIEALRDVSPVQLSENESVLPALLLRRARHVVTENDRVVKSVEALEKGDVHRFGEFLFQSHQSLREDYEVSCPELDLLVDLAARQPGTLGARMTGAGFGGCTVNLVEAGAVDDFCKEMKEGYLKESQIEPFIYVCRPSDGVFSSRLLS